MVYEAGLSPPGGNIAGGLPEHDLVKRGLSP
jgi:hypothetical protein